MRVLHDRRSIRKNCTALQWQTTINSVAANWRCDRSRSLWGCAKVAEWSTASNCGTEPACHIRSAFEVGEVNVERSPGGHRRLNRPCLGHADVQARDQPTNGRSANDMLRVVLASAIEERRLPSTLRWRQTPESQTFGPQIPQPLSGTATRRHHRVSAHRGLGPLANGTRVGRGGRTTSRYFDMTRRGGDVTRHPGDHQVRRLGTGQPDESRAPLRTFPPRIHIPTSPTEYRLGTCIAVAATTSPTHRTQTLKRHPTSRGSMVSGGPNSPSRGHLRSRRDPLRENCPNRTSDTQSCS
ncbi:UNVERIFIED_CONTAM: hypothetical protein DES50_108195 [Williamsia faeni]